MVQQAVYLVPVKVTDGNDMSRNYPSRFGRTIIRCSCTNYLSFFSRTDSAVQRIRNTVIMTAFKYRNDIIQPVRILTLE